MNKFKRAMIEHVIVTLSSTVILKGNEMKRVVSIKLPYLSLPLWSG